MSSVIKPLLRGICVGGCALAAVVLVKPTATDTPLSVEVSQQQSLEIPELGLSVSEINFGRVKPDEAESVIVSLTNTGAPDSGLLIVDNFFLDEFDSQFYSVNTSGPIVLAPSESYDLVIGFVPTETGLLPGRLILNHNGRSGVDIIDLNGEGFDSSEPVMAAAQPASFPFGKSKLKNFNGGKPTSLQFGPDGRLYVAFMDGTIQALTVERTDDNNYKVVDTDNITLVKNILNHNDDGSKKASLKQRLVTGLLVTGTADQPIVYVHSSDPRIGGGHSGKTTGLDTNSGVLSRLTLAGAGWNKLDLVRGLPRSEENHHSNGMALVGTKLYLAAGGNTNMGATSNNFAMLPEYALSAAILEIDLNQIGNSTYDLPTLDDENRNGKKDQNDPFGGNRGKNQAMLVDGGPVQVYAPGFRNPYDVVVMQNGKMYSWDNGPNAGWGGSPGNCSNKRKEPGTTQHDALHLISGPGYYGGHPNPTRGSQSNKFNNSNPQSPVPYGNSIECNYYGPGTNGNGKHVKNKSLVSLPRSTNGLAEYTANNFSGAINGDLLATSWDNKIYRASFKPSGALDQLKVLFSNVGKNPLDVTAQSEYAIFPGTIWVADLQGKSIVVYEPDDYLGGDGPVIDGGGCSPTNGAGDSDEDGFSDEDELANGTDGCSAADSPADADGDFISDLLDEDDDNDGIKDVDDPFALDDSNGASTSLDVDYQWENDSPDPGFIASLGFSGLMTNGEANYQSQFDLNEMTIIGAAGVVTIDNVPNGDPLRTKNSQQYGFQFGVNVDTASPNFRVETRILAPFSGFTPAGHQSMGLYIGTGDQDNYLKLTIKKNEIQLFSEVDGQPYAKLSEPMSFLDTEYADLSFEVDPASAVATAFLQLSRNEQEQQEINLGTVDFPPSWLTGSTKLAVGIISTSVGADPFPATWDYITVKSVANGGINEAPVVSISPVNALTTGVAGMLNGSVVDDGLPSDTLSTQWSVLSGPGDVSFTDNTAESTPVTFAKAGTYVLQLWATDGEHTPAEVVTVIVKDPVATGINVVYRINAGGPTIPASQGDWLADNGGASYANTGSTWKNNVDTDVSSIGRYVPSELFKTERFDRAGAPDLEWKLPVTPGDYQVRLYLSENYIGAMVPGGRVFDVTVEGKEVTDIDVFATAGAKKAMMKVITANSDGILNIAFNRKKHHPSIKGIEVLQIGAPITQPTNQPPVVSAGADLSAEQSVPLTLSGSVSDDGLPDGSVSHTWSMLSGPATAQFSALNELSSKVVLPAAGLYLLRLTADDGALSATDDMQVEVVPDGTAINSAPLVVAGADIITTVDETVGLGGVVTDDGLPGATVIANWSSQSGPAAVAFGDAGSANTTASFPVAGTYTLRLSASDTQLSSFDELSVGVTEGGSEAAVVYRINAGGAKISDPTGDWSADNNAGSLANTGKTYTKNVAVDTSATPLVPAALFQSERWDKPTGEELDYKLPVAAGAYEVRLYFAEIYNGAKFNGGRVFDVTVEGQALPALDVYAESGGNTALVKSFIVNVVDGAVDISFGHVTENPAVKGIEVISR